MTEYNCPSSLVYCIFPNSTRIDPLEYAILINLQFEIHLAGVKGCFPDPSATILEVNLCLKGIPGDEGMPILVQLNSGTNAGY